MQNKKKDISITASENRRWLIPEFQINNTLLPRLFLGDRAFLKRYNTPLKKDEIINLMEYAASISSIGLTYSDKITSEAAQINHQIYGNCLMQHTQNMISVAEIIDNSRIGATIRRIKFKNLSNNFLKKDRIIGNYIKDLENIKPFFDKDLANISINDKQMDFELKLISTLKPSIITIGGDWLDLCLLLSRYDLINKVINQIISETNFNTPIIALTYLASSIHKHSQHYKTLDKFNGLFLPINLIGDGMYPSKNKLLNWAKDLSKPLFACHPLAIGRVPVLPGLDYIYNHEYINSAVVGASNYQHISALIDSASKTLGQNS